MPPHTQTAQVAATPLFLGVRAVGKAGNSIWWKTYRISLGRKDLSSVSQPLSDLAVSVLELLPFESNVLIVTESQRLEAPLEIPQSQPPCPSKLTYSRLPRTMPTWV